MKLMPIKIEYSDGDLIYLGKHHIHRAATNDSGWSISKFTWSGGNIIRDEGPLKGAWDNRASLNWG